MRKKLVRYTCVLILSTAGLQPISTAAEVAGDLVAKTSVAGDVGDYPDRRRVILAMAREANEDIFASLQSFVCHEQIQRFKGSLNSDSAKQIDTVWTNVSFENGTEHYNDVRQNERQRPALSSLAGAWSEGEFGTLLRQTQQLLNKKTPMFEAYADVSGLEAAIYVFDVTQPESPWVLEVGAQRGRVPFRTRIWVSQTGGQILKIERMSLGLPFNAGISQIRWNVMLKDVELSGRNWLLPSSGEYSVEYEGSGRREWNVMEFSDYRRYGSEVAIRFQ